VARRYLRAMQINCVLHLWIDADMLNSEPIETGTEDAFAQHAASQGSAGAIALAGIATLVVVAIWFAFYLLVFVPRAGAP
jgi:hypothetical protein